MGTKTDYQKFIEKKHSSFSTPIEVVSVAINKYLDTNIKCLERLIVGESNEVYDAIMEDGRDLIIRISHSKDPEFYRERWAMEASKKKGVPTPKILIVEDISDTKNDRTICIEEKVKGKIMADMLNDADINQKKQLVILAGEMLSKIHQTKTSNFGKIDAKGHGRDTSWLNFLTSEKKKVDIIMEKSKAIGISSDQIDSVFSTLEEYNQIYVDINPHLLHGDYGPKHLFVKNEKIVGVIDMEHAMSGDPANDFAWWDYFRGDKLPIEWLKEGYIQKDVFNDSFDLRLNLCKLSLNLSLIQYYSADENPSGLNYIKGKFIQSLEYFNIK